MNRVNFFFYTTQNYGSLNKIGSRRIVKKKNFKFWVNSFEWITFKIIDQPMKFKYWGLTLCFISLSVWVRTKKKKSSVPNFWPGHMKSQKKKRKKDPFDPFSLGQINDGCRKNKYTRKRLFWKCPSFSIHKTGSTYIRTFMIIIM